MSAQLWENETRPEGADNTRRPLTRITSTQPKEGLAMQATRQTPAEILASLRTLGRTPCWQWPKFDRTTGYASFYRDGSRVMAHRWSYETLVAPIPAGLVIDHVCRNRACVNPGHLRPVTSAENTLAGIGIPAQNARKEVCDNGHEFTPENTRIRNPDWRTCITCESDRRIKTRQNGWDSPKQCPHCPELITASCLARHIRRRHGADRKHGHHNLKCPRCNRYARHVSADLVDCTVCGPTALASSSATEPESAS